VSVTYTAVLDVSEDSVLFLSGLLHGERVRRRTRTDTRALSTYMQAVLALRWLFDDTRMSQLARDNGIGVSTAYDYRDAAMKPSRCSLRASPHCAERCWPGRPGDPRADVHSQSMTSKYSAMTASKPGNKGRLIVSVMLNQPAACDSQSSR
jgi:hypothetical protein